MVKDTELEHFLRTSWQWRAIERTQGNKTRVGTLLLSMLGIRTPEPPRFTRKGATITANGMVYCAFQGGDGRWHQSAIACTVSQLEDWFEKLADDLALSEEDREDMRVTVAAWVEKDLRPNTELFGRMRKRTLNINDFDAVYHYNPSRLGLPHSIYFADGTGLGFELESDARSFQWQWRVKNGRDPESGLKGAS